MTRILSNFIALIVAVLAAPAVLLIIGGLRLIDRITGDKS